MLGCPPEAPGADAPSRTDGRRVARGGAASAQQPSSAGPPEPPPLACAGVASDETPSPALPTAVRFRYVAAQPQVGQRDQRLVPVVGPRSATSTTRNGGSAGVDGETVADIESRGVDGWLGALAGDLKLASKCFSRCRCLHRPLRLLPAGATVAGRDSHPLRDGAFHSALPRPAMG